MINFSIFCRGFLSIWKCQANCEDNSYRWTFKMIFLPCNRLMVS